MDRPGLSLLSPQGLNSVVSVNCDLDCHQKLKYRSMSCSFVLRALDFPTMAALLIIGLLM
jgi:hypothetical protein